MMNGLESMAMSRYVSSHSVKLQANLIYVCGMKSPHPTLLILCVQAAFAKSELLFDPLQTGAILCGQKEMAQVRGGQQLSSFSIQRDFIAITCHNLRICLTIQDVSALLVGKGVDEDRILKNF
jgi:hypothetical protein